MNNKNIRSLIMFVAGVFCLCMVFRPDYVSAHDHLVAQNDKESDKEAEDTGKDDIGEEIQEEIEDEEAVEVDA